MFTVLGELELEQEQEQKQEQGEHGSSGTYNFNLSLESRTIHTRHGGESGAEHEHELGT